MSEPVKCGECSMKHQSIPPNPLPCGCRVMGIADLGDFSAGTSRIPYKHYHVVPCHRHSEAHVVELERDLADEQTECRNFRMATLANRDRAWQAEKQLSTARAEEREKIISFLESDANRNYVALGVTEAIRNLK